jgi:hypothetical protein
VLALVAAQGDPHVGPLPGLESPRASPPGDGLGRAIDALEALVWRVQKDGGEAVSMGDGVGEDALEVPARDAHMTEPSGEGLEDVEEARAVAGRVYAFAPA